eukprot:CAMPEP_0168357852 /NCGR_PEP_ID=MMETSP0228-20121227/807_1 /TAXON_ID=133427 /ORGANISM="Protoceratium reticulatum, Strain CCCM 535 (=CCMP 1889)" /LENGTH=30 /DNA_ID= /DNA_START= /DNA_END= /DNA_ORIENTATION=
MAVRLYVPTEDEGAEGRGRRTDLSPVPGLR